MLSGDNGLLKRAGDARDDTVVGQEKEQVELAYISAAVKKLGSDVEKDDLQDELDVSVGKNKTEVSNNEDSTLNVYFTETEHNYNVNGGTVAKIENSTIKITEFSISGTTVAEADIPVPTGFTHTEGTKDTGYVIQDGDGNKFVWVPVDISQKITVKISSEEKITSVVLTDPYGDNTTIENNVGNTTYSNTEIEPTINGPYRLVVTTESGKTSKKFLSVHSLYAKDTFADFQATDEYAKLQGYENLQKMLDDWRANEWTTASNVEEFMFDYSWMKDEESEPTDNDIDYVGRVAENGGFYVGKYEATYRVIGETEKAGSIPSTNIRTNSSTTLTNGMLWNCINQPTALSTAKAYNTSLKSSLLTGAAWDRILGWLYETGDKSAIEIGANSSSWGNYKDEETNTSSLANTGATSKAVSNNIYDLAGNVAEWTTESNNDGNKDNRRRQLLLYNLWPSS